MKTKMSYAIARQLAETVIIDLAAACERIEIAGSIRRKKPEIGDIEIVCIPKYIAIAADLFGNPVRTSALNSQIYRAAKRNDWEAIKDGDMYKQYNIGPCSLDLFITTPEKWGCVFTIRTGSAEFTHRLVTARRMGGLCPSYMRFKDGRLWNGDAPLATPEESDVFKALGIDWIEPEKRLS